MSRGEFKKIIKEKIEEKAFQYLMEKRNNRNGKGMEICYSELKMQKYLQTKDENILNIERKTIFQLRTKMHWKIKTNFRKMHQDSICDGCRMEESNLKHTLNCPVLIGRNELVTYIPDCEDIYGENEDEQVYICRIFKDNLRRLPDTGPCEPALQPE